MRRGGLEPPSRRHAPLKRTRIPVPPPARLLPKYYIEIISNIKTKSKLRRKKIYLLLSPD